MTHIAFHIPPTNKGLNAKNNTTVGPKKKKHAFPKVQDSEFRDAMGPSDADGANTMRKQAKGAPTTAPVSVSPGAKSGAPGRGAPNFPHKGIASSTAPTNLKSKRQGKKMFPGKQKTVCAQAKPTFPMKSFGGQI